ncbi:peptidase dimerization domain-containing protein [Leifsonia sp. 71-9]|uniref:peptidase dimerization domain-containing protein n=1 Tax=Leifsonia sp. 71-9 TaxID=1895934 RepID=UPI0025BDBB23|nr:peptidase dimerization domain-containing protein [Leifsonia sp. 71-9]
MSEVGGFSVPFGDRRGYLVATAEKGVGRLDVTARGSAGHGSRPTSDNAITRVARAVAAIGEHRFPLEPTTAVEAFARRVSELLGETLTVDDLPAALDRLGIAGPLVAAGLRNTVSPTVIAGGYKSNVIPAEATAQFDVRVVPGAEERLRAEVEALVGEEVELRWDRWIPPIEAASEGPLLDVFASALAAEDPDGVLVPFLMPASTDNKHLARIGVTGYGFVPLRTDADFDAFGHYHAVDERIPLDALAFSVRTTARILRSA